MKNILTSLILALIIISVGIIRFIIVSKSETVENPIVTTSSIVDRSSLSIDEDTDTVEPKNYKNVREFVDSIKPKPNMDINMATEDFVIQIPSDTPTASGEAPKMITIEFRQWSLDHPFLSENIPKSAAIQDIFKAYKENKIYRTMDSSLVGPKIWFWDDIAHPRTATIRGIRNMTVNLYDQIASLEQNKEKNRNSYEELAYLYDFRGNYEKTEALRKEMCTEFPSSCIRLLPATIKWTVLDDAKKPIIGAKVEILNNGDTALTDVNGNFELKSKLYPLSQVRFRATKWGYSDGFRGVEVNIDDSRVTAFLNTQNFILHTPEKTADAKSAEIEGEYYIFRSSQTTYRVPTKWLHYMDGSSYESWDFKVTMFEFNKSTNMANFMTNDTFSPVYGYVGNIMKTFGMPYIQFFDPSWKELYIYKSNPMIIKNQIYEMNALWTNQDKIYTELKSEDMKLLVEKSKELWWFPIDFDFLTKNNLLRWPAWWCLDRKKWVWENIGSRVLDEKGLVELPFYSINDQE